MFDNNLEQKIAILKAKLPSYLRSMGLNPASKFCCINPQDHDNLPSMSYDPNTLTVKCFNCKASYNIFDLLGFRFHLDSFKEQFIKAHELFLGPVSPNILQELNAYEQNPPQFEFAGDFEIKKEPPFSEDNANLNIRPFKDQVFSQLQNQAKIPAAQDISFSSFNTDQNVIFGKTPFGFNAKAQNTTNFAPQSSMFFNHKNDDMLPNFGDYLAQCTLNCQHTDYFRSRGISDEVVKRFSLGYDPHCFVGIDKLNNKIFWQAVIFPYGHHGYRIRNTNPLSEDRFRGKGFCDIFNAQALETSGTIFITEGEMDALSLETLGFKAIALGGVGNIGRLIELIRSYKVEHSFYICLDNDKSGKDASLKLASAFYQIKIPYRDINIAYPYKDPNEALCQDMLGFKDRLQNLEQLLSLNLLCDLKKTSNPLFINVPEDLDTLKLSGNLYTLCGRAIALRLLLANILNASLCSIFYIATHAQCTNLQSQLKQNPNGAKRSKFLELCSNQLIAEISTKISTCVLQGQIPEILVVDASTLDAKEALALAASLNEQALALKLPILMLGSAEISSKVESLALQNIEVSLTSDGDFKCTSVNSQGQPVSFIKYAKI